MRPEPSEESLCKKSTPLVIGGVFAVGSSTLLFYSSGENRSLRPPLCTQELKL